MPYKITLIALLVALSVAVFPPSMIATDNIEFNSLTPAGGVVSYTASLGNVFTVTPKVSLIWTGFEYPALTSDILFGWTVALSLVSSSQLLISVTPLSAFTNLKFKWVATQGDHLQVFPLSATGVGSSYRFFTIPFDYSTQVAFDPSNSPIELVVQTPLTGFQWMHGGTGPRYLQLQPAKVGATPAQLTITRTSQVVSQIYGASATFNTNSTMSLFESATHAFTAQITLIVHRVMLPSETSNPTTGFNLKNDGSTRLDGSYSWDFTDPRLNYLSAGPRTFLTGIIGSPSFSPRIPTQSGATRCLQYFNFTSISAVTNVRSGYQVVFTDIVGFFYVQNCYQSCQTCSGIQPNQCLTCPGGLNPFNGECACPTNSHPASDNVNFWCCPYGCTTCTSTTVCTACEQRSFRIATPSSDLCPCLDGFYEDAVGNCVVCPTSQHCKTCQLSGGSVICTDCACSQNRESQSNTCPCKAGFTDNSGALAYCQKI